MARQFALTNTALLYAFRILLGCIIVWVTFDLLHVNKKEWGLITVIIVSEPDFGNLRNNTFSRVVNTVSGCIIGLLCITLLGANVYSLLTGIGVSVLISTTFKKYPSSWKLAPATVALLMSPSIAQEAGWQQAIGIAITRTGEVLYGCVVAFLLGLLFVSLKKKKPVTEAESQSGGE